MLSKSLVSSDYHILSLAQDLTPWRVSIPIQIRLRSYDAYLLRTQPQPLAYSDQITVSVQRTTSFAASPKALSSALIGWVAAAETGADA